jgi:hypothetical protein
LTSAVTVLSADDPVRVFQNFGALDLISKGRAEMIVGRSSFVDAYPLFGLSSRIMTLSSRRSSICCLRFAKGEQSTGPVERFLQEAVAENLLNGGLGCETVSVSDSCVSPRICGARACRTS